MKETNAVVDLRRNDNMRISTKARYALRALIELARRERNGPTSIKLISRRQGISPTYLNQLMLKLRKAGLVKSVKGPGGGFLLAKPAKKIRVMDVLSAIGELLPPVPCLQKGASSTCKRQKSCPTRPLWKLMWNRIENNLRAVTIEMLCSGEIEIEPEEGLY